MKLSEYIAAWEDGEAVELMSCASGEWSATDTAVDIAVDYSLSPNYVRIRPKLKAVDMSVLVGSGVDCGFSDELHKNALVRVGLFSGSNREDFPFRDNSGVDWKYCKPRMNYWFSYNNFTNVRDLLGNLRDAGFSVQTDVGCFKIVGLLEGYCWPWEVSS